MATAVAKTDNAEIMEQVIIKGDLAKLTPQERTSYYMKVCESVGLNPLTRPFEYIALNGKLQLYALKACTEQLRGIHDVSVTDLVESLVNGVFIVTAKVKDGHGRTDAAKGAVPIDGLKGEALANAMMKAETKAKRRATLSLCGLGWLDESEIESIPGAKVVPNAGDAPAETVTTAVVAPKDEPVGKGQEAPAEKPTEDDLNIARQIFNLVKSTAEKATDEKDIDDCLLNNRASMKILEKYPGNYNSIKALVTEARERIKKAAKPSSDPAMNDDLPDFEEMGRP